MFDVKNNIKELYYSKEGRIADPYKMKSSINYRTNRRYTFTGQFSISLNTLLKTNDRKKSIIQVLRNLFSEMSSFMS